MAHLFKSVWKGNNRLTVKIASEKKRNMTIFEFVDARYLSLPKYAVVCLDSWLEDNPSAEILYAHVRNQNSLQI